MKSFIFISLLFLIFQISVARVIPFRYRGHGSPVASPSDDSLLPSSIKPRAEAVGRMGDRLLATLNLGNDAWHQHEAIEAPGAGSKLLELEEPVPTPVGRDMPKAGYGQALQNALDLLVRGMRYDQTPSSQQPSLTAETPIPTTQLMRMTMEDNPYSASPLPSAPTRIPSWVKKLIAQDRKAQDGAVGSPRPTPTSAANTRQLHAAFIKKTTASLTSNAAMLPAQSQISETQSASTWDAYMDDVSILFDNFGPELVMVGVFILFPISVLVAEALEILWRRWTPERFPERGRGRIRLTGAERRLKAWENWEREKLAEKSRAWWKPARKYR
ncbi:hypothetical protein VTN00DRAFT_7214 [Thermoascus crustaceus]|uniref:uncharacterized protein n=1 Tax=Thermoascus crustaceus TaxID=5088 RepID=UPI00374327B0